MSKAVKKGVEPRLRFPEFKKSGNWEEKTLGKICDYWNGAGHERGVSENGTYFLISLNSLDIEGNLKSDMKKLNSTDSSLQKDDMVMVLSDVAHGNFLGLTAIVPNDKYVLNQRMAGLRVKDLSEALPTFVRKYINHNQKYFKVNGQGSSQLNLSKSSVIDFPVLLPTVKEQEKIAECLSSLDEVITAQGEKVEALKTYKKGLLQQLFPQDGETTPRLRFPEFKKSGDWEERSLSVLTTRLHQGVNTTAEKIEYAESGTPILQAKHISSGRIDFEDLRFLSSEDADKYSLSYIPKENDILLTNIGTLGKTVLIKKDTPSFLIAWNIFRISTSDKASSHFLKYFFELLDSRDFWSSLASGNATKFINKSAISNILVKYPKIKEQQKIAECLSSLDEVITAQGEILESLKIHKKGLLQQLFPSLDEVING